MAKFLIVITRNADDLARETAEFELNGVGEKIAFHTRAVAEDYATGKNSMGIKNAEWSVMEDPKA